MPTLVTTVWASTRAVGTLAREDELVRDLAVRLAALDPEAGAALRVVAYFDELAAGRAGLHAVVRGAAALTGTTAGFRDERRHLQVRIDAGGHSRAPRDRTGDTTQVGCDG